MSPSFLLTGPLLRSGTLALSSALTFALALPFSLALAASAALLPASAGPLAFGDNAFGELVFLLDPGHVILPSFMGGERPMAMHGYDPKHRLSSGAFLSDRTYEHAPGHIKDMMEVMAEAVKPLAARTG